MLFPVVLDDSGTRQYSPINVHRPRAALRLDATHNFCRRHQTLRISPAMEAGIADHIWTIAELIA
jgi:hypothetical protein